MRIGCELPSCTVGVRARWLACSRAALKAATEAKRCFGVFGQSTQHHLLNLEWNRWHTLAQRRRWHAQVLGHQLAHRSLKGTLATQPFVDDDRQRILVAGRTWVSLDLLRGHIGERAGCPLCTHIERGGAMGDGGNAKIGEQHLLVLPDRAYSPA